VAGLGSIDDPAVRAAGSMGDLVMSPGMLWRDISRRFVIIINVTVHRHNRGRHWWWQAGTHTTQRYKKRGPWAGGSGMGMPTLGGQDD